MVGRCMRALRVHVAHRARKWFVLVGELWNLSEYFLSERAGSEHRRGNMKLEVLAATYYKQTEPLLKKDCTR